MTFLPRPTQEGWHPIRKAPWDGRTYRLSHWQGDRFLWERVGQRAPYSSLWLCDGGLMRPTHWKDEQ